MLICVSKAETKYRYRIIEKEMYTYLYLHNILKFHKICFIRLWNKVWSKREENLLLKYEFQLVPTIVHYRAAAKLQITVDETPTNKDWNIFGRVEQLVGWKLYL